MIRSRHSFVPHLNILCSIPLSGDKQTDLKELEKRANSYYELEILPYCLSAMWHSIGELVDKQVSVVKEYRDHL